MRPCDHGQAGLCSVADVAYVPVLKGRGGEFLALRHLDLASRQAILPVIEVVPAPADSAPDIRPVVLRTVQRLGEAWATFPIMVDLGHLDTDVDLGDGHGAVWLAAERLVAADVTPLPVMRLGDAPSVDGSVSAVRDVIELRRAGLVSNIALRLSAEDMDDEPEATEGLIDSLLEVVGFGPAKVILLLDLGEVTASTTRAGARLVADALADHRREWHRVVAVAGAFPVDLSTAPPWEIAEFPRADAAMWNALTRRAGDGPTTAFGDYAVAHPRLVSGVAFRAAPQLRYAVSNRWLVLKGRVNDPRGHDQFTKICAEIAATDDFAGARLGWADNLIEHPTPGHPGNASTWRAIGTAHHIDYVVARLTNLAEP